MKKTFNINIVGYPFTINEDAYLLLNDYLKTIEHAFRNVDGAGELTNDIESRIAELLLEASEDGKNIITLSDVEQVIARVGKPEEFVEDDSITLEENGETETINVESQTTTPPPYIPNPPYTVKRLYRDPQNAMLGGVCSGLAWYLGWDVTWVRLLVVALTILSYFTMGVAYLILWIVVPEARTPLQRMQMMGEQPTVENIGKTVTDSFKEDQNGYATSQFNSAPSFAKTVTTGVSWLAKAFIIIGLIIGIPILLGLGLGFIGCVVFLISWGAALLFGSGLPFDNPEFSDPFVSKIVFWSVLCGIGWILTVGIPLFYLIGKGLNFSPLSKQRSLTVKVIWILGFILAGVGTGMVISSVYDQDLFRHQRWEEQRKNGLNMDLSDEDADSELAILTEIDTTELRIEMIPDIVSHLQETAEQLQKKAELCQNKAENLLAKAENASPKSAAKYQKKVQNYQHKAEKYQLKAQRLLDKAAKVLAKGESLSATESVETIQVTTDTIAAPATTL